MTAPEPELLDRLRARLAEKRADPTPACVAAALRSEGRLVGDAAVLDVVDALRRDMVGAGPLDELLCRPGVTDVLVNGPTDVYVDSGSGLERSAVGFPDDAAVRRLAQRLAAACGRRLDDASPYVDVQLRDGTRLHAILAPVARRTCLSLRIPAAASLSLADMTRAGTLSRPAEHLLRELVRSKVAFLVSGGTGSGKTTLLSALLSEVDQCERLIIVEEARELRPAHGHVVSLEARQPNVEGLGEITVRDLVRQALRMRPDRLVVGEVRGAEVVDLLAALNTGHRGGSCTVHANSAVDVPARLEALGVGREVTREALHSQIAAALQVVVHLRREADGHRRLAEVAVLERDEAGLVRTSWALRFEPGGSVVEGPGIGRLHSLVRERP